MDYQAALIEQNRRLTDAVFSAKPDTQIPTCPDWTMRQLIRRVGQRPPLGSADHLYEGRCHPRPTHRARRAAAGPG